MKKLLFTLLILCFAIPTFAQPPKRSDFKSFTLTGNTYNAYTALTINHQYDIFEYWVENDPSGASNYDLLIATNAHPNTYTANAQFHRIQFSPIHSFEINKATAIPNTGAQTYYFNLTCTGSALVDYSTYLYAQ